MHWEASKQAKAEKAEAYFPHVLFVTEEFISCLNFSEVSGSGADVGVDNATTGSTSFCRGNLVMGEYFSKRSADPPAGQNIHVGRESILSVQIQHIRV